MDPHIYLASGWRLFTFLVIKSNNLKFMEVLSRKIIQFSLSTILIPSVNCPLSPCAKERAFSKLEMCVIGA